MLTRPRVPPDMRMSCAYASYPAVMRVEDDILNRPIVPSNQHEKRKQSLEVSISSTKRKRFMNGYRLSILSIYMQRSISTSKNESHFTWLPKIDPS
jgi:hypothetical protein